MDKIEISKDRVDYDALYLQAEQLVRQHGSWKDQYDNRTGVTLLQHLAAMAAFNVAGRGAAQRENFIQLARRPSSIYAATESLGVRISRKSSAQVSVQLSRTGDTSETLTIPAYTQFAVNSRPFFNRQAIMFPENVSQLTAISQDFLFEGALQEVANVQLDTLQGFRRYQIAREGFTVADADIRVMVNGEWWERTDESLWQYGPESKVFFDRTSSRGEPVLIFGNGVHGKYVSATDNVRIFYVETSGAQGNFGNPPLEVTCSKFNNVSGVTTSPVTGGSNEKDPEYYRFMAPYIHRTQARAVNPPEHSAIILSYPDVADVLVQGQRHIAPNDIRYMNHCRIIILPHSADSFSTEQKRQFADFFRLKSWAYLELDLTKDAEPVLVDVVMAVYAFDEVDTKTIKSEITKNVRALFDKKLGILGRTLAVDDISAAADVDGVDYVTVIQPTTDLSMVEKWNYVKLRNLVVNVQPTGRRTRNTRTL